jgi:putative transposase
MKSSSSRWIKTKEDRYRDFAWQAGYGGFSVFRLNLDGVKRYLSSQKEHHKAVTFKEEFLLMLQRAQIPYEEKYLWD